MKKYLLPVFIIALVLVPFLVPSPVLGQDLDEEGYLEDFREDAGYGDTDLPDVIGNVVRIVLGLMGLVAVVLIIVGGFQWMTSGGNEEKIGKAKQLMGAALIGLVIVVLAYAIAEFVINQLTDVTVALS